MTTGLTEQTMLSRTMRRAILNAIGNEELADRAMDAITSAHPHLSQVWEAGTCKQCRAILSDLERLLPHGCCEWCEWRSDQDVYEENLRRYGSDV